MRLLLFVILTSSVFALAAQAPCDEFSKQWLQAVDNSNFTKPYTEQALAITHDGILHNTSQKMDEYKNALLSQIGTIRKNEIITCATASQTINYEISKIETKANKEYAILSIWNEGLKEFEMISPIAPTASELDNLNNRRSEWIKLCNKHNARKLVENLYESEAIYYNHRPVDIGIDEISERYSYMNRESYSLHLDPIGVLQVSDHLIYEIGQCSGSYTGKYMLIWRKKPTGEWKILFDSNI